MSDFSLPIKNLIRTDSTKAEATDAIRHTIALRKALVAAWTGISALLFAAAPNSAQAITPVLLPPDNALRAEQVGIVINDRDPLSIEIGNYYRVRRKIPEINVVHLSFTAQNSELPPGEFAIQKKLLDARMPKSVQALALAWTAPYRVGCMSITSAFTFGYDIRYCAQGCFYTETNAYFDTKSTAPFDDFQIRPSMLLAARDLAAASALIERGIASDGSLPHGSAYLVTTTDNARNVRKQFFPRIQQALGDQLPIHQRQTNTIENAGDVMFYFTGLAQVKHIDSNHYLPGAVADHLTSSGGQLTDSSQMSALRWLEAGATGSYGTVVEPCAFVNKFPNPLILMQHYLAGETLLEAYWKSVQMPGQGVFIGEPLARPYAAYEVQQRNGRWYVGGPALLPGNYSIFAADKIDAPFTRIATGLSVTPLLRSLELPSPVQAYYRLQKIDPDTLMFHQ